MDTSGNAYVTGYTQSSNFPTASAIYRNYGGNGDAFVTKLNTSGSSIIYSTYLGGSKSDNGLGIAVDTSGNAYIAGYTNSSDFPTVSAIYGSNRGNADAFVTKLNADGISLDYSTYLGGSGFDYSLGIAVDTSGTTYVTGDTQSSDFPTASAIYGSYAEGRDAFITKISVDTISTDTISTTLVTYGYDKLSRLTQITYGGNGTVTYTYDAVGNRESISSSIVAAVTPTPTATPTCPNDGDVNMDGKLTAKDALLAFEYVLGKASLTPCQQTHADVNGNGKVTAADALCIFKAVLNGSSPSETLSCE